MALPPTNFVPLAAHSSCFSFSWELWLLIVLYRTHRSPNRVALYGCLLKEFWCDQSLYCISVTKHPKHQQAEVVFLKILWEEWKKRVFCFILFSYATLWKMHKWIPIRQFNSLQCSVCAFLPACSWPSALWLHPFSQLYSWNWWFPIFVPGEEFSNSATRLSEVQDPAATDYRFDLLHLIRLAMYWLWFVECSKNVVHRVWTTLCLTGWMDW